MKLIEADAKRLLRDAGVVVPDGHIDVPSQPFPLFQIPCVLKAQVLSGRRGQRKLVRRVTDEASFLEAKTAIEAALTSIPNAGLLIESDVPHVAEWLLSVDLDRVAGRLRVSYSPSGGMEVTNAKSILVATDQDIDAMDAPDAIRDVARRLVGLMRSQDALSIEINPLAILEDGSCVALDAKMELDDAALGCHPEWASLTRLPPTDKQPTERETAYAAFLEEGGHRGTFGRYVELDGDIALILSGGGASIVALDALARAGLKAANYCEISGNPDSVRATRAASIVLSHPGIKALWMAGSFANFTDIHATVMAVLRAVDEKQLRIPIVIRRDGPNADAAEADAKAWAAEKGITLVFHRGDTDLDASAEQLAKLV